MLSSRNLEFLEIRQHGNRIKLLLQILQGHVNIHKSRYMRAREWITVEPSDLMPHAQTSFVFRFFLDVTEEWTGLPARIAECTDVHAFEIFLDSFVPWKSFNVFVMYCVLCQPFHATCCSMILIFFMMFCCSLMILESSFHIQFVFVMYSLPVMTLKWGLTVCLIKINE